MNAEVKIFANVNGFAEIRFNSPQRNSIFSEAVAEKRSFDGERGTFPNGTFSVYYAADTYVLAYHFRVPSDAKFRDTPAQIAVAVKRGYRMLNPTATFMELANLFTKIALEDKDSLKDINANRTESFYGIIDSKIVADPLQFRFNATDSVAKLAIFGAKEPAEKDLVLSDPFRKELNGIDILYIINYEDGAKVSHLITSGAYKAITGLDFQASKVFTLVYPDGHRVEFADLNQALPDYTIRLQYHEPLTFSGSVGANMAAWRITVSADKSEYKIGLLPEKETKEFQVQAQDQKGHPISPSLISARLGVLRDGVWILVGEEIERRNDAGIFTIQGYEITQPIRKVDDSTFCIIAKKLYMYDFTELMGFLSRSLDANASVKVCSKSDHQGWKVSDSNQRFKLPVPYSDVYVQVPETTTTEAGRLDVDNFGRADYRQLKKKVLGKIKVIFGHYLPDDLRKKLEENAEVGSITCTQLGSGFKKEAPIDSFSTEITDLPLKKLQVEVKINGYKTFVENVDLRHEHNQEIVCDIKPTIGAEIKKYCKRYIPVFIVGIILGVFIGLKITDWRSSASPTGEGEALPVDSLTTVIKSVKHENDSLRKEIMELLVAPEPADAAVAAVAASAQPEPKEQATKPEPTAEQKQLIDKLKGNEFTKADIEYAKKSLKDMGFDALIKDADASLTILNLSQAEKKQLGDSNSNISLTLVNKLKEHKAIMTKIINSEDYKASTRRNYKSIQEAKKHLNIQ